MTNMDNNKGRPQDFFIEVFPKDDSKHLEKISDFKTYAKVQNINN